MTGEDSLYYHLLYHNPGLLSSYCLKQTGLLPRDGIIIILIILHPNSPVKLQLHGYKNLSYKWYNCEFQG